MNETNTRPNTQYIDGNRAQQLLEKWSPVLDYTSNKVSAIKDSHTRLNTAMLLENQEQWCLKEANVHGGSAAGGIGVFGGTAGNQTAAAQGGGAYSTTGTDTYANGDARLPKILIPMIRRTFPELITNEIVGVQPMSGPVGLAFALRYKYSDSALGSVPAATSTYDGVAQSEVSLGTDTGGAAAELGYQNLDTRFSGQDAADNGTTFKALTASNGTAVPTFNVQDQGMAAALSAFELDGARNAPTIELSFEKTAVEAGTRRLGARWSVELE